jgi:hypothetical protein
LKLKTARETKAEDRARGERSAMMDPAIVGHSVPDMNDLALARRIANERLGPMTPIRMVSYSAVCGVFAGYFGLASDRGVAQAFMIAALLLYAVAFYAGQRTMKVTAIHCLAADQNFEVTADGLTIVEPDNEVCFRWSHFEEARETATQFALCHGLSSVVVPKRAFSETGVDRLREEIAVHMKTNWKPK